MSGSWWVEIVFLGMLAGFIALRLVSVLGRRTGHEENPVGDGFRGAAPEMAPASGPVIDARARPVIEMPAGAPAEVREGLSAIASVDGSFDPARFAEGAKAAYRLILEAFWKGDVGSVEPYVSDDVADQFRDAVDARTAEGHRIENRLVAIESARIVAAHLSGMMAEVTVRFEATIASATRDSSGRLIAGSASDAVATADEWTFRRHVAAGDPNWLLVATDSDED